MNEISSESIDIVRADEVKHSAGKRRMQEDKTGKLQESLAGVVNVSESVEIGTGTWEVHKSLQGKQYRSREVERRV